jgi:IS5 family transposase
MAISPGNASDYKAAKQCLAAMPPAAEVIADKDYDSDDLRDQTAKFNTSRTSR